jgi:carbon monoxide dehydrogenase subunit G
MPVLHETIDTPLPIDDAFAFVADFANAERWDPGVATSARLDAGPVGLGTRYRLGVRMAGRVAPMEYVITTFDAPHHVVLTGSGSNVHAVDTIRFSMDRARTRIDYTADIRLGGWMRLLQPFVGGAFDRLAKAALGGMQRALDDRARAALR